MGKRYSSDLSIPEKVSYIESLKVDGVLKDILGEYLELLKKEIQDIDTVVFSDRYEETNCCMGVDGAFVEVTAYAKTGRYTREVMSDKFMEYIIQHLDIEERNYTKYLAIYYCDGERGLYTPLSKLKKDILKGMRTKDMPGGTTQYTFVADGEEIEEFDE